MFSNLKLVLNYSSAQPAPSFLPVSSLQYKADGLYGRLLFIIEECSNGPSSPPPLYDESFSLYINQETNAAIQLHFISILSHPQPPYTHTHKHTLPLINNIHIPPNNNK
jgi:hypothetical protein